MEDDKQNEGKGLTRRQALKASGLALGGLAVGGALIGSEIVRADGQACSEGINPDESCQDSCPPGPVCHWTSSARAQRYSYFQHLPKFNPFNSSSSTKIAEMKPDEMRITFMGSGFPPPRKAQQMMSVFVEVGWDGVKPLDQFVFDAGAGVVANYSAMNVGFSRMDKVFITHLHGDHMSDVTHIYCFGPSADRKSPLYVWGPSRSNFVWTDPRTGTTYPQYRDGTADYCLALRQACRWHTESFSFQNTSYSAWQDPIASGKWQVPKTSSGALPSAVLDTAADGTLIADPEGDGFAIVPVELNWQTVGGIAYFNESTRVKITYFPVIHTRRGSIGYKLEWWPPGTDMNDPSQALSMIYTGDTKVESNCVNAATNDGHGVDVLVHEMIVPAQVYTMKSAYSDDIGSFPVNNPNVELLANIQASSHSPQGPFGYLLGLITPRPRLTVATHFPVADDTVSCAMKSVQEHFPNELVYQGNNAPPPKRNPVRITWAFDLMVINVSKDKIVERQAKVSDFTFSPWENYPEGYSDSMNYPKYDYADGSENPYAQIDTSTQLPDCTFNSCNYRDDGY
jgi:ribonuclease Z